MLQKNHHFLFPQTFFGSLESLEEQLTNEEDLDLNNPWILILESDQTQYFQQKIELFIHWSDDLG